MLTHMNALLILPLDKPEHAGDWHDKPLRYKVVGPGAEVQKFSTKAESQRWERIRRNSPDFATAFQTF